MSPNFSIHRDNHRYKDCELMFKKGLLGMLKQMYEWYCANETSGRIAVTHYFYFYVSKADLNILKWLHELGFAEDRKLIQQVADLDEPSEYLSWKFKERSEWFQEHGYKS